MRRMAPSSLWEGRPAVKRVCSWCGWQMDEAGNPVQPWESKLPFGFGQLEREAVSHGICRPCESVERGAMKEQLGKEERMTSFCFRRTL